MDLIHKKIGAPFKIMPEQLQQKVIEYKEWAKNQIFEKVIFDQKSGEQKTIEISGQKIVLNHYSMTVWDQSHRGSWQLYGHSHHSLPDNPNSLSIDVGCNGWDYKPLEFEQIKKIMSKKIWKPIDHHE